MFQDDLARALDRLSWMPGSGARYESRTVPGLRRIFLSGCRYHVYYTVDAERSEVLVRAIWHAVRGQGPDLR
jgi:plasmid stabilization system protein ParE